MHTTTGLLRTAPLAIAILLCTAPALLAQAGSLDPTFAANGILAFPATVVTAVNAVAIQGDGKIVVAGAGPVNSNEATPDVLVRLNTNGTLDATFGTGGIFTFNPSGFPAGFFALAIQSDGKIVAASTSFLQLVRVTPAGTLDTSFGKGGITPQVASAVASTGSLALESDGRILVAYTCGGCGEPSQIVRYLSNGKLDISFGSGGFTNLILTSPVISTVSAAVQLNGKILVMTSAGQSTPPLAVNAAPTASLVRYNSNGAIDQTFGAQGIVPILTMQRMLLPRDGSILVAGGLISTQAAPPATNNIGFGVARYSGAGLIDSGFGGGGAAITDFGAGAPLSAALALAVQVDGDIVAGGIAGQPTVAGLFPANPTSFGLARYTSAGVLDTTFGSGGTVVTSLGTATNSWITSLAVQADGNIVAAGTAGSTGMKGFESAGGYVMRYLGQ